MFQFELEIIKVHEAHEALVKLSDHREALERIARAKLHLEIKQLKDTNLELKDQLEMLSNQITNTNLSNDSTDNLRKELNKRDVFIAQLVSQSKFFIYNFLKKLCNVYMYVQYLPNLSTTYYIFYL